MFSLFSKKRSSKKDPLEARVRDMKCRRISYVDCGLDELAQDMERDPSAILGLTPVNYYAVKNEYISALIYTNGDYSENYVRFKRISFEKLTGETKIYALDGGVLSKALAKVGIIIKV